MLICIHFRLNIKDGIGWLCSCNAEQLECARTERSDPLVTTAHVSSPAPFMCTYTYIVYIGHLRLDQLINAQLDSSISSMFFSDPWGASSGSVHAACKASLSSSACVQLRQVHGQGDIPCGLGLWGGLFECFTVPLEVHLPVGHGWFFSVQKWVGQFQTRLRYISLGSDRGIAVSLTGKCSWRQAVELSVGVRTNLVLEAWDICHSICTGKRRRNSCKSKELWNPITVNAVSTGLCQVSGKEGFSFVLWCLRQLERSVKIG